MPFEEFDKKIKEASEHYHPAYDETAWKKMNDLLEDGLPVKKDDWRRIYYFLFLLIFITAGGYLLIEKPWKSDTKTYSSNNISSKNTSSTKQIPATNPVTSKKDVSPGNNTTQKKTEQVSGAGSIPEKNSNLIPFVVNKPAGRNLNFVDHKNRVPSKNNKINPGINSKNSNKINKDRTLEIGAVAKNDVGEQKQGEVIVGNTVIPGTTDISDNKNEVKPTEEPALNVPLANTSAKSNNKKQKRFISNFGLTISAGPDKSSIFSSNPGKTTLYYGAGLRYDITKRITVKTGFYITDKIYTAAGKDYKQTNSYYPTFTLTSVDADCKIFEVPLVVNYNFIQHKKNNLFGSIGASSYFMKRETYHYHYNDAWGQYRYGAGTYNNENKHYFSVVTLGAGYERKLNHVFSVIAEPYVKLPLSGIGEGRIKLNSAGLLVSLSIKPFAAKEQKK